MAGSSSRTDAATTHRHQYRTLPASDMTDNNGLKISEVGDGGISDEEEPVKQGWWTRERFVFKSQQVPETQLTGAISQLSWSLAL